MLAGLAKEKNKYVCFLPGSCCFLLFLDKRHLGGVPRLCKPCLPGQESRGLNRVFFSSAFLPASSLSLIITSVLGPMPNSPALTPQYTQARAAEQPAMQHAPCCSAVPSDPAPAHNFCLQEESFGFVTLLESCAQLAQPLQGFPEK